MTETLYLSYDGMTDPLGQSQVLPYLLGLSKNNYTIHLISFEKPEKYAQNKHIIEQLIAGTSIVWHPLMYHQKPPVLSTLYDIWTLQKTVNALIKSHPIKLIHCRSYITSLVGLKIKKNKNIPFLFDMRGFWANERIDGNIWNLKNPIFKSIFNFFKKKEREFIIDADHIVSLTHNAKTEIESWNLKPKNELKIDVIPCCADLNHFSKSNINQAQLLALRNELKIKENDYVLTYIGSLGTWYMIDEMMAFYKVLLKSKPEAIFIIITGDNPDIAYKAAEKVQLHHSKIRVKKASRNEVPYLISFSKFSLFFIKPAYSKKASSPTKLAEILGMGVPVICNSGVGDVAQIVEDGNVGVAITNFDETSYAQAIEKLNQNTLATADEIVHYANKYASLEDGISTYLKIYNKLTQNN